MISLFFLLASSAQACTYHIYDTNIYVGDRYVNVAGLLNQKIQAKGYVWVPGDESPEFSVRLDYRTIQKNYFEYAFASTVMVDVKNETRYSKDAQVRCYTQFCAAKDGMKAIQKSIEAFSEKLKNCSSQ